MTQQLILLQKPLRQSTSTGYVNILLDKAQRWSCYDRYSSVLLHPNQSSFVNHEKQNSSALLFADTCSQVSTGTKLTSTKLLRASQRIRYQNTRWHMLIILCRFGKSRMRWIIGRSWETFFLMFSGKRTNGTIHDRYWCAQLSRRLVDSIWHARCSNSAFICILHCQVVFAVWECAHSMYCDVLWISLLSTLDIIVLSTRSCL